MQVHKEAIDKVPNSLPNRSNIEIEIYGMEGIPAQDLKDHEKHKNGNKSESDDDEPSAKKNKLEPMVQQAQQVMAQQPQMMLPNIAMPNMAQFPMMAAGFQMMPGIPMQFPMMGHRPMFPNAVATSAMTQQKPTFPAYSNATISAPPTTNLPGNSNATSTSTNMSEAQKPQTIPQTSTSSKIVHPPEDVSLEELRARKQQYKSNLLNVSSPQSSASSTPTSAAPTLRYNESKLVAAAQEVS